MKTLGIYAVTSALLLLALALDYVALDWRSPDFSGYRTLALVVSVTIALLIVVFAMLLRRRMQPGRKGARALTVVTAVLALVAVGQVLVAEGRFQWMRYTVLNADPDTLERLGQHFIVGYRDRDFVATLGQRRAVAGFFITHHNVRGMDELAIGEEVRWLRSRLAGEPESPVWIATDQEGGVVSRLSPPLPHQPPLGEQLAQRAAGAPIESVSRTYGREQGEGLSSLGVNLNFSPVVDIDHEVQNPADRFTRISTRALSDDPVVVATAAGAYCQGLADFGVRCTLKHFPGIGRVFNDTHVEQAVLSASPEQLRETDWLPFRQLAGSRPAPWIMLSHVMVSQVDPDQPASTSDAVVQDLLREQWGFDGVLITDDLCMRAIHDAPGGVGQAAVDALNAGVDILLISYDPDQYYPAMYALLLAQRDGRLNNERLRQSGRRLSSQDTISGPSEGTVFPPERPEAIPPSR